MWWMTYFILIWLEFDVSADSESDQSDNENNSSNRQRNRPQQRQEKNSENGKENRFFFSSSSSLIIQINSLDKLAIQNLLLCFIRAEYRLKLIHFMNFILLHWSRTKLT